MNSKNIKKSLKKKLDDWVSSINDEEVKKEIKKNAIITGGAIVSLLNNEQPHDYDVILKLGKVYIKLFNIMQISGMIYTLGKLK